MAIPTLTANAPDVGYISWTAFTIQYLGTSYPIAAGYTANKFVWWLFNNGSGGPLQAGDTLPTLTDDDLLLFLNKNGTPVNVQTSTVIDGSIIASGSILGDAIAANTITGDNIMAGSILSEQIGAGEVKAINIEAGAVTADALEANLALLGAIQVGTAISINPTDGIVVQEPNGQITQIAADGSGSSFSGSVTATDLTVLNSLDIRGDTNFVTGIVQMSQGTVLNPKTSVSVQNDWDSTDMGSSANPRKGLALDGSGNYLWTEHYLQRILYAQRDTDQSNDGFLAPRVSGYVAHSTLYSEPIAGGASPTAVYSLPAGQLDMGVAVLSGVAYILYQDTDSSFWVLPFNLSTQTLGTAWKVSKTIDASSTIGVDAANSHILISTEVLSGSTFYRQIQTYTLTGTWVSTSPNLYSLGGSGNEATSITFKSDESLYYMSEPNAITAYNTSWVKQTSKSFPAANGSTIRGMVHDGTIWHTFDSQYVWDYTNLTGSWDFSYTWYDSTATGGTYPGTAETMAAPVKTVTVNRSKAIIQLPNQPPYDGSADGADTARLYGCVHGGTLGLLTTLADGVYQETYSTITPGAAPPASNGFDARAGVPGAIQSGALAASGVGSAIQLQGDGYAFIDHLYATKITGMDDVHIVGQAGEPSFANGWSNNSSTDVQIGFAKDPFNYVHLQGVASGGTIGSGTQVFTLPAGYRPSGTVNLGGTGNGGAANQVRITTDGRVAITFGASQWNSLASGAFLATQ